MSRVLFPLAVALLLCVPAWSQASPPGPGFPSGPAAGPVHWGGGHPDHGLPPFARELWIGGVLYFVAAGTYYLWSSGTRRYEVVEPPVVVQGNSLSSYEVIAYPARGQSAEQQGRDRYECHSWAVGQSGFDPATSTRPAGADSVERYRRALGACLSGRGYSIS